MYSTTKRDVEITKIMILHDPSWIELNRSDVTVDVRTLSACKSLSDPPGREAPQDLHQPYPPPHEGQLKKKGK